MESSEHCCLAWIQQPLPAGILKLELQETTCLQVGLYQLLGWQLKYVFNVHQDPLGFQFLQFDTWLGEPTNQREPREYFHLSTQ